jgi:phosphatidate cytidylyltransferase
VIGDLAESVIKRALDAKDSGRMLPGIGGSLDLIDSICFTAPALYFYMKWFILRGA